MLLVIEPLEARFRRRFDEPTFTSGKHPTVYHTRRILTKLETMAVPTDRISTTEFSGYCTPIL